MSVIGQRPNFQVPQSAGHVQAPTRSADANADTEQTADTPQTPQQLADSRILPIYERALKSKTATIAQLTEAFYYSQERFLQEEVARLVYERYYPLILDAFQAAYGDLAKTYFCKNLIGCVVVTSQDEMFSVLNSIGGVNMEPFEELSARIERLKNEGQRLLKGRERRVLLDMLYSIVTQMLAYLENRVADTATTHASDDDAFARDGVYLNSLNSQANLAADYLQRAAQRSAQVTYFFGMLLGVAALAVLAAILVVAFLVSKSLTPLVISGLLSFVIGGVGAVVSVMTRMASDQLTLKYEAGDNLIRLFGGFRPVIGAVFGVVFFFLIAGGLLPVAVPTDVGKVSLFFAGIAFLAGFSERLAQDILVSAEGRLQGGLNKAPEETKSRARPSSEA